jgi:hypothetical protein
MYVARSSGISLAFTLSLGSLVSTLGAQAALWTVQAPSTDSFVTALDAGLDVSGDGIPDVLVGAMGPIAGTGNGSAQIRHGANGAILFSVSGPSAGSFFGRSVALLGDLDGDSRSEFAVGAPSHLAGQGRLTVYSGADASAVFTRDGDASQTLMGNFVQRLGDLDQDGVSDFVIGYRVGSTETNDIVSGATFTVIRTHGGRVSRADDIDSDGRDDYFLATSTALLVLDGASGAVVVSTNLVGTLIQNPMVVGDVDGDGLLDYAFNDVSPGGPFGGGSATRRLASGADGSVLSAWASSTTEFLVPGGDFNGDCRADGLRMIQFTMGPNCQVISGSDGTALSNWTGLITPIGGLHSIADAGDIDNDGFPEAVAGVGTMTASANPGTLQMIDFGFTGTRAAFATLGTACPGSAGNLALVKGLGCPRLGESIGLMARNTLPSTPMALNLGMPIDVNLDFVGLPGCTAVASADGFSLFGAASVDGVFSTPMFAVPVDPALLGVELAAQALAVDVAANAAGLVASRGLLIRIGS